MAETQDQAKAPVEEQPKTTEEELKSKPRWADMVDDDDEDLKEKK
jgi:hypothetical protein